MYNISPELLSIINNNDWIQIINQPQSDRIVDIHLSSEKMYENIFNRYYTIKPEKNIKKTINDIVLLFPCHPIEGKRILRTIDYSSYSKLGREINERIQDSKGVNVVKFAIASQEKIFRVRSISGTIYVIWAVRINQEIAGNSENIIGDNIPVLYEYDGEYNPLNIVILPRSNEFIEEEHGHMEMYPISLSSIKLYWPLTVNLLPCEVDRRGIQQFKINTVSDDKVEQITRKLLTKHCISNIDSESIPFESIEDGSISINSEVEYEDDIEMVQATPRINIDKL